MPSRSNISPSPTNRSVGTDSGLIPYNESESPKIFLIGVGHLNPLPQGKEASSPPFKGGDLEGVNGSLPVPAEGISFRFVKDFTGGRFPFHILI